jgi:peptidoglycan/LPS O-acetylase OafA/YrhL
LIFPERDSRVAGQVSDPPAEYRADIDGLRGVAILSVLAFHAFPQVVRGGFVGVDVFFVISGYLISSIIFRGLSQDRFTLRGFYARRIRRLFPALIVVLAVCLGVGWFSLLANEYTQLGKHIAGGAGFSSNLVLWNESGYFDRAAELKPLLHLWSLGVEEQFYIVWPLLLVLAWKRGISLLALTLSVLAVSFVFSITASRANLVAAFYSPIPRFWEILLGGALAVRSIHYAAPREGQGTAARNVTAVAGVLLIAAAVFGVSRTRAFPGWWALLPTIGAFLIIAAGPGAWLNRRILSHRLAVLLGLISYPLYLWHWPLLSFANIFEPTAPSGAVRVAAALASVLLAWLTYTLVERPVRNRWSGKLAGVLLVLMLAIGALGAYTFTRNGFETRFPEAIRPYANYQFDPGEGARPQRCWLEAQKPFTAYSSECVDETPGKAAARPLILVWGDSYAARLYVGMRQVYGDRYRLAQFTRDSCPPVGAFFEGTCADGNAFILGKIQELKPDIVVLFGIWDSYSPEWTRDTPFTTALVQTVGALKDLRVPRIIVVGPAPKWTKFLPELVYKAAARDPRHRVPLRMSAGLDPVFVQADALLKSLLARQSITYVSLRDVFCNTDGCLTHVGQGPGNIVSADYGHLTTPGGVYVARRLLPGE